ncbi:hypothetical protein C8F01DRAFT_370954 [Mycena amicta]|nr:hypothetical protein C8F01DRAFT_370954 [Mycena amicta]
MSAIPAFVMSLLCIVGGGIGFAKKGSIMSLVSGLTSVPIPRLDRSLIETTGPGCFTSGAESRLARDTQRDSKALSVCFLVFLSDILLTCTAASALLALSSAPRVTKGPVPKLLAVTSSVVAFYYSRLLY